MSDEVPRLYGDYLVIARDEDGGIVDTYTVEETGTVTVENALTTFISMGIDELEIRPQRFVVKKGDEVITEWEH